MSDKPYIDLLNLYYGADYSVTDYITIHQPTILEIIEYGEIKFWSLVARICANPTSVRLQLWDIGLDWNTMSDYDLFVILTRSFSVDETRIVFGDLDLSKYKPVEVDEKVVLVHMDNPLNIIDEEIYLNMVTYLRTMFDFHPKTEKAANKWTKDALLQGDRQNIIDQEKIAKAHPRKTSESPFLPLISFCLNHPGFKYKKDELGKVGLFEFMESLKRIQNTESVLALMHGMYSGFIDTSGIDASKDLNLLKDLTE